MRPSSLLPTLLVVAFGAATARDPLPPPGEWVSRSYGYHLSATPDGYVVYDVLGDACTRRRDEKPLFDRFARDDADTLHLRAGMAHEPYDYLFERVSARCHVDDSADPIHNMSALRTFFAQHYAFDMERGVPARTSHDDAATPLDGRNVHAFLARYHDAHVAFSGVLDGKETELESDPGPLNDLSSRVGAPFLKTYWSRHVAEDILGGNGTFAAQRRIQSGIVDGDIGYVALVSMGGYAGADDADDLAALDAALVDMARRFRAARVRGVIVDLSANSGGYDHLARRLAGQFTGGHVRLYCKQVRTPPSPRQCLWSEPARGSLDVPVAVLTSRLTVSAAEVAVLALRAQGAMQMGEPTRGALSDALVKYLPGGASITLSNEVYTDSDGIAWEAHGIPPQLALANLDAPDPLAAHAALVHAAAIRLRAR